ncbi:hypothetical protein PROFUN_03164 [Planoprotostelium fungivorum]|uniref:Uncharacterized protein n=1 Tax=Planoprotostelium fungivorum TaxID=1890364 RepID=A0A2P6NWW4_9EUKA|nr:hypothetical protein PROFUN_03164 [Planoprotostelium fungivorum]
MEDITRTNETNSDNSEEIKTLDPRKQEKRDRKKAAREAKKSNRQGSDSSVEASRKPCDLCHEKRDVLVRCMIDDSEQWKLICTKGCWQKVSGGQVDGVKEKEHYRYGGMWKNHKADVTAKKPKHKGKSGHSDEEEEAIVEEAPVPVASQ